MDLDLFDRQLLNLLQDDSSRTADQLSAHVGLSPSAIQRRIKRLRSSKVIQRDIAVVDPKKTGSSTFFIVALEVERERPELLAQLRRWMAARDHIQQVFYVTGDADFILVVTAPDTDTYDRLMADLVSQNPNIRRFTTNVALGVVKRGLVIPVVEDQPS